MSGANSNLKRQTLELVEEQGPWPFVTRRVFRAADGTEHVYRSRHHRKGLVARGKALEARLAGLLLECLWMPGQLNWWIGIIFALGSLLFAVASALTLAPGIAQAWSLDANQVNAIFFLGSIPFTIAAYLQLFQAANAGDFKPPAGPGYQRRTQLLGWQPNNIGWISCALQFVGTILFNFNTLDALLPSLGFFQQEVLIWVPNIIGSILFLCSGYLAFIEICHAHWAFLPHSISWWVGSINLIGCICFMIAAMLAIVLPGGTSIELVSTSVFFTFVGAVAFLIGSLLLLPETVVAEPAQA